MENKSLFKINGPGHMTKMATTPIYGKSPLKIFFRTIDVALGMWPTKFVQMMALGCP